MIEACLLSDIILMVFKLPSIYLSIDSLLDMIVIQDVESYQIDDNRRQIQFKII